MMRLLDNLQYKAAINRHIHHDAYKVLRSGVIAASGIFSALAAFSIVKFISIETMLSPVPNVSFALYVPAFFGAVVL